MNIFSIVSIVDFEQVWTKALYSIVPRCKKGQHKHFPSRYLLEHCMRSDNLYNSLFQNCKDPYLLLIYLIYPFDIFLDKKLLCSKICRSFCF